MAIALKVDRIEQNQCDFRVQYIKIGLNQLKIKTLNLVLNSETRVIRVVVLKENLRNLFS